MSESEQRAGSSAMSAAWFLQNGIEALRQAGASPERIAELRQRLTKYQADSLKEMKTVSTEIDISKIIESAREHVKHPDLREALFKFAFGQQLFGEALCFELRGCLIEKTGWGFRNRIAHGFVSEAECYSDPAQTIWWLVLRLCLTPIFQAISEQKARNNPVEPVS